MDKGSPNKFVPTPPTSFKIIKPPAKSHGCNLGVFKPIVNEARSARAYGSAALEIIHVATGKLGAYMTPRLQPLLHLRWV
jgi:fructose-1,6-bisphosphatase/inositol monophosphatase family enzyme